MAQHRVLSRLASMVLLFCVLQVEGATSGSAVKRILMALYNNKEGQKVRVVNLKYERCGQGNDPGRLTRLDLTPTPEGNALVTLSATCDIDLKSPVQVTVELYRRVFGAWVKIPCISNFIGSCVHDDVCKYGFDECPLESLRASKIPCHCPIAKGTYTMNQVEIPVPLLPNARLLTGDYKAQVVVRANNAQLACYSGSATVEIHNQ